MSDDPDVKKLLGRAFDSGEPPLRIDRDEVFRVGRKRLRTRRIFEASSVVAGVVAAAVGAVLLTGLVSGDERERLPPAADTSDEQQAPPGPTLPLPTQPQPPRPGAGASEPVTTTTTMTNHAPPSTAGSFDVRAEKLTNALYQSGLVHVGKAKKFPPETGTPEFELVNDAYLFRGDVFLGTWGSLEVMVTVGPRSHTPNCGEELRPYDLCEQVVRDGLPVVIASWKGSTGEKRYLVQAMHPDGTVVTAIASNTTERDRQVLKPAGGGPPVLSEDELVRLVSQPSLRGY